MAEFSGSYCIFIVIIKAKYESKNNFIFNLKYLNFNDYKKLVKKRLRILNYNLADLAAILDSFKKGNYKISLLKPYQSIGTGSFIVD